MKKKGRSFNGKVCGIGMRAEIARAALRVANTEVVAQRIRRAQPGVQLDRHQIVGLAAGARLALEDIRLGQSTEEGIGWVVNAANMALIIAELGLGGDYIGDIKAAQEALMRMLERQQRTGRYTLDGPGLTACALMMDVHQAQLESQDMTDQLMLAGIDECKRRQELGRVLELQAA